MPTFKLTWTIDAEGTDALDAARRVATDYFQARIAQGHPDTACVFQLTDHEGQAVTIDLSAHRIHLECAHAAECERLRAGNQLLIGDLERRDATIDHLRAELSALKAQQVGQELDELRRSCAEILGQDPETWPSHGNAPLAIASALALTVSTTPQPAPAQDVAGLVEALKTIYDEDYQAPHDSTDSEIKESMKRCIFRIRRIVKDALAAHDKQSGEKKS